jgi:ssDNA-binding Zn-finger/Zn-ribbon topoisomerase 1
MEKIELYVGMETGEYCPECKNSTKLILRQNSYTSEFFIACPNYPECKFTKPLSEELKMRLNGQETLF